MRIVIDTRATLPVFAQLMHQMRDAIRQGVLKPGEALPTIRQLAHDLQLNPNTVAKAYGLLERDGVIETLGRKGSVVRNDARRALRVDLPAEAGSVLGRAIDDLRARGLTDSEIRNAFAGVMRA